MAAAILLVDDDNDRRDSVRNMLNANGSWSVEAVDCENALSLIAGQRFDLILVDITLPDKSGFRVLDCLKDNRVTSKVIVMTGVAGIENAVKSSALGARNFITRPYNPTALLRTVAHVLSSRIEIQLKIQIVKAGDFIQSTPTGDLDMKASEQGLAQIAATGIELQDYTVLIDLREVTSQLSTADIYDLGSELAQYGKTFRRKIAVLARDDKDLHQATFFENVAHNRGFEVRAFTVFEDAVTWLWSTAGLT